MSRVSAVETAVLSLLDVVQELAVKVGDRDWSDVVVETFKTHREEIRSGWLDEREQRER